MAKRFTETDKWDDDWFLDLPPVMKCAWEWIRDNCDGGTGIVKISFKKVSSEIKGEVTKEDFEKHLGSRIHWINHERLWIPGFLFGQFKNLSPNNKAHVNMARKVICSVGSNPMSERTQSYFDKLLNLLKSEIDSRQTLDRPSTEGPETLIGYRIQDIGKDLLRGEYEGEIQISPVPIVSATQAFDNKLKLNTDALFDRYPNHFKSGKAKAWLAANISTQAEYERMSAAIKNYAGYCEREKLKFKYTAAFVNWVENWEFWLDQKNFEDRYGDKGIDAAYWDKVFGKKVGAS